MLISNTSSSSEPEDSLPPSALTQELLPLLLPNVRDYAIFLMDVEGTLLTWNPGVSKLLGYEEAEWVGQRADFLFTPADLAQGVPEQERQRAIREGQSTNNHWYLHKDGSRIWVNGQVVALIDQDNHLQGFATLLRDETERKGTEDSLRERSEQLRLVVEIVEDYAIFTTDPSGFITSWNSGAEQTFGWIAAEIIGQSMDLLFTPEDRERGVPEQERQTACDTGTSEDERWHVRKDGSRFYGSDVTRPFKEGVQGFVKVTRDLKEKINAEQALSESKTLFRMLADAVPQIIWSNEGSGKAAYFNQRWFDYSGLSYEESVGPGWQVIVHPEDEPASVERWDQALLRGETFDAEYRLRRFDGVYRWHIGRNVPIHDSQGHITGWFGSATDIEDLKQAEAELQRAHDLLEARVEERTHELSQALEQLQAQVRQRREAEAARAALVKRIVTTQEEERGRISRELHDNLGQHLTAVMLGLQQLEIQVSSVIGGKRRQSVPQLKALCSQVDRLMQAAHRQAWELRPAELDAMGLEVALEQYIRDWSERTGLPVDYQAVGWEARRPDMEIETTLYRVVQEALTNVVRHAQATQVGVVLEQAAGIASAIIEDNGRGFDPEQNSARLGVVGMRERLSIVGGALDIESSPRSGTTVFARIPLQTPPQEVSTEDVSPIPGA